LNPAWFVPAKLILVTTAMLNADKTGVSLH